MGNKHSFFGSLSLANNSFIHVACLVLLIVVIYANTLNAPFQWDESDFIVNNPIIKDLHYFTSPSTAKGFELYSSFINRYIGYLTFALNYRIHGLSVTGYHIVNIAIHIANSILVYFLVLLTFRGSGTWDQGSGTWDQGPETRFPIPGSQSPVPGSQSPVPDPWSLSPKLVAFFSAAIFAVHPLQTEAVTYVFQRFASLAAFFYLLSLVFYIKARMGNRQWAIGNGTDSKNVMPSSRITFLLISLVSAVLAMKTKENAFTLPLVIVLYEFCFFSDSPSPIAPRQSSLVSRFLYLVPILLTLLIVPLTLMSLAGTHQIDPGSYGAKVFSKDEYLFTQFRVIVTYLRLFFFPVGQNLDYDYPVFKSFLNPQVILSFLFLSALFGLGLWLILAKNRRPSPIAHSPLPGASRPLRLMGFGILWFFITLSVESSIIPLPMLIDEYRMYLPSAGLIISAVTGFFLLVRLILSRFTIHDLRFTVVLLVFAIVSLSVATHLRNAVWGDSISLWEDTAEKSPNKPRAHYNLGNFYKSLNMPDKAMEQYLVALKLKPDDPDTHNNLGLVYFSLNMPDKAIEQYLAALKLRPEDSDAHNNLGLVYYSLNMPDKAIEQYLTALKLKPDFMKAHFNLGVLYQTFNMPDKAMEQYLLAIKLRPDSADAHYNLGVIYLTLNMYNKAVNELRIAVDLNQNDPEGHFNLGVAYYKTGQIAYAQRELTAVLKIKPVDQRAQQLLNQVLGTR